jgi:hypothetical protein
MPGAGGPPASRAGHLAPQPDQPGPGPVVRIDLASGEYALAVEYPDRAAQAGARLGLAVLVARPAGALLSCPRGDITAAAAAALADMASRTLGGPVPAAGGIRFQITRVPHPDLPSCLHPAFFRSTSEPGSDQRQVTAHICANLISAGLAAALTVLYTAYLRLGPP